MLGVRHQADDPAVGRRDACDVAHRAVGVVAVAEHHPAVTLELVEHVLGRDVAALAGFQRHQQVCAELVAGRPRRGIGRHLQPQVSAHEVQSGVAGQGARQQPGFTQHLKSVADAQYRHSSTRGLDDGIHHGRELGDGAAAQVVAVGKAAGYDDGVDTLEVGVGVPQAHRLGAGEPDRACGVDVVECAGERDDARPGRS